MLHGSLEASDSVDSMWTSGSWFEHVEQQCAPIRRAITTSLILDNRQAPWIEWTGTTPRDASLRFMNRVHREVMVELMMDANVRIPPSQPNRHDDPPQDTPQDTELEDTNWVYNLFIPQVTEQETMCLANIGTYTVCNPFADLLLDPCIFPDHPKKTRQSAPASRCRSPHQILVRGSPYIFSILVRGFNPPTKFSQIAFDLLLLLRLLLNKHS